MTNSYGLKKYEVSTKSAGEVPSLQASPSPARHLPGANGLRAPKLMAFPLYRGPPLEEDSPMRFLSQRKTRHTTPTRSARNKFRPCLEALEGRSLLSAGALDPTFGTGGMVTGTMSDVLTPVVVQPDGKIVVGGNTGGKSFNFELARYNSDGSLDSTFGPNHNGIVSTAFGNSSKSAVQGLALESNGDIVAVGHVTPSKGPTNWVVARYTSTGTLDSTFGSGGIVQTTVGQGQGYNVARAVAIYPSGTSSDKIYVAGYSQQGTIGRTAIASLDFTLVRYNMNGSLDTTFGPNKNGIVVTPNFSNGNDIDTAESMAIQPNGDIVLAGTATTWTISPLASSNALALARYLPTGALDTTFDAGGSIPGIVTVVPPGVTNLNGYGVVVQSSRSNAIVVSSYNALARFTSGGSLDTSFGGSGSGFALTTGIGSRGLALDPNGDLLASGESTSSNLAVAAYSPDGIPDTTFGNSGIATANFSGGAQGFGIAIQPSDGKIVVAGSTSLNTSTVLTMARFLPPDTKIGSFTASPNPATAGSSVILTASNILNSNPTSTITQVTFSYAGNSGSTVVLSATQTSPGVWTYSAPSGLGLTSGSYTVTALATDSSGVLSDPLLIAFTVM
jgi:uncharacterized delta-60 repeat protein